MKKLLLTIITITSIKAGILEMSPVDVFKKATPYEESGVGFELVNKSKRPIWIAITNGDNTTGHANKVEPVSKLTRHEARFNRLDITKPTQLAVWYSDPGPVTFEKETLGLIGKKVFKPEPKKVYSFPTGKTLYLTWDKANYARPQTGPLYGKLGKTDSNLSLKKNVKKEDIKEH